MTSTRPNLDAIRAREAAATPGPWGVGNGTVIGAEMEQKSPGVCSYRWHIAEVTADYDRETYDADENPTPPEADAEFIAHARQDVADLLAEVDRLRTALADERAAGYDAAAEDAAALFDDMQQDVADRIRAELNGDAR